MRRVLEAMASVLLAAEYGALFAYSMEHGDVPMLVASLALMLGSVLLAVKLGNYAYRLEARCRLLEHQRDACLRELDLCTASMFNQARKETAT